MKYDSVSENSAKISKLFSNFADIRQGGYVYVDKTNLVYKLANEGCYYSLSRPRRFGKSLLISTLEAYFHEIQGNLELYFQNTMSVMFRMMGLYVKTEISR